MRLLLLALLLLASPAAAEVRVGVRAGNHASHGRLVFDWPHVARYEAERAGAKLRLRFHEPASLDLSSIRRPPRNVARLRPVEGGIELELRPGATPRLFRLGNRVVVDVMNAAPARPASPPRPPPVAAPEPPPPEPAPVPPPRPARLVIPAAQEAGAALLARGGGLLLVLDAPLRPDPASPLAAEARLWTGASAATVLLPPQPGPVSLRRDGASWLLEPVAAATQAPSLTAEPEHQHLALRVARPGRAVAVPDPETGGILLVGTLRNPEGEAQATLRRLPQLDLLPTLRGIAVLPRADTVELKTTPEGFVILGASIGEGAGPAEVAAAAMSRLLELPPLPPAAMQERLRVAIAEIGALPPLARGGPRRTAAALLLGLGLPQEAQAMASVAAQEDPRLEADPAMLLIRGAAALLSGRLAEAAASLEHSHLPETDETSLWRALLAEARAEAPGVAAASLARAAPIAHAYPPPLRQRLLPGMALSLAAGGELVVAHRLLAGREDDPAFGLARARLAEAEGDAEVALAQYAAIAVGRDRQARAAAIRQGVELRLATGRLDATGAAAALEKALFSWRGDAAELSARRRLAELKRLAGDRAGALDLLQDTEALFPEQRDTLRTGQAALLLQALEEEAPQSAAMLLERYGALLPETPDAAITLATLAERLAEAGLPGRALALLRRALELSPDSSGRAVLGARIAELALAQGEAEPALAALSATAALTEDAALLDRRGVLEARALARLGEKERAAAVLRGLGSAGLAPLAELLAEQRDWPGAAAALSRHLEEAPPGELAADSQRDVALLAAFASLAGDQKMLAGLRERYAGRLAEGPLAEVFGLLSSAPVTSIEELPRARREVEIARQMAANPEALRTSPPSLR